MLIILNPTNFKACAKTVMHGQMPLLILQHLFVFNGQSTTSNWKPPRSSMGGVVGFHRWRA